MYPETLLLPRKDRKNVTTEEDKEGTLKKRDDICDFSWRVRTGTEIHEVVCV